MSLSMLKGVADYLTPVLHSSQFSSTGVLTPEEFTSSGDQLVHAVRTWKWEAGPSSASKPYLQPNKQYLITRNVPCLCRANAYEMQVSLITAMCCLAASLALCSDASQSFSLVLCLLAQGAREELVEERGGGDDDDGWLSTHAGREGHRRRSKTRWQLRPAAALLPRS